MSRFPLEITPVICTKHQTIVFRNGPEPQREYRPLLGSVGLGYPTPPGVEGGRVPAGMTLPRFLDPGLRSPDSASPCSVIPVALQCGYQYSRSVISYEH